MFRYTFGSSISVVFAADAFRSFGVRILPHFRAFEMHYFRIGSRFNIEQVIWKIIFV